MNEWYNEVVDEFEDREEVWRNGMEVRKASEQKER